MNWTVPQVSPLMGDEELVGLAGSVERAWLTEGPMCEQFRGLLAERTGAKHAILAPNGTLALFLGLLALDLPPGSEVLVPSFTFFASASAVVFAGHVPVFVDVDPTTYNVDVTDLERHLTPKVRAIMPVHVYGHAAPMRGVSKFAAAHDLLVIEDAAQGFGVEYFGRHLGTIGDVGIISFFADKTITTGEGAVVLTDDDERARRLRLLRNQGRQHSGTFVHEELGMNFRITDMQAAVGVAQMARADEIIDGRRARYAGFVERLGHIEDLGLLQVEEGSTLVPFRFTLRSERRDELVTALERSGVQTRGFFYPLHLQPPLVRFSRGPLPVAEELSRTGLCLPIHDGVTPEVIDAIGEVIEETLASAPVA